MSDVEQQGGISRRTLVKSTAIGSLALAAGGLSLPFGMRTAASAVQQAIQPAEEKWSGEHVRSTAVAAAPCVSMSKMMKSGGWKPTTPAKMSMAITRCAPACADVQSVGELTILIASTTR
ncbi:anaerobic dimethyl sulfoxide reductase chain A [Citrobacter koseri]|nr:anaerobic dimethyl sulfoxide reductase chain A [Citrobacter koseri]